MEMIKAEPTDNGMRLDVFLSEHGNMTRSAAQKLIEDGCVTVNGETAVKRYKIKTYDEVRAILPVPRVVNAQPQNIPLDIVYEDDDIIVVNKPQGMVVHPAAGNYDGTLVNALMHHTKGNLSAINGVIRPGIVHRIDKDTSGILVVAKNNDAHLFLAEQIKAHSVTREYICLIHGGVTWDDLTVDKPIGRDPKDRKRMIAGISEEKGGRNAVTHFHVEQRYRGYTQLRCRLETGRTHQIRVHLKSIGKHIVGDKVYGLKEDKLAASCNLQGQLLHAEKLGFIHPTTSKYVEYIGQLPGYFLCTLNKLEHI
ncbi:MAG: RluA family pseudouridine synthase [Clostridia bacterium]|nr:RluA family pseudouridine synthase [Clostridia bacterium]